jgi:hypothetical protein
MYKLKIFSAYVFFVGLPLLALVGILRAGAHLNPPLAVRGDWNVLADFSSWRQAPCEAPLTNTPQPLLNITQSGEELTITLNNAKKIVLAGTINGTTLLAAYPGARGKIELAPKPDSGCLSLKSLRLQAEVKDQARQRSLTGTFTLDECASCPSLAFSAIRQIPEGRTAN